MMTAAQRSDEIGILYLDVMCGGFVEYPLSVIRLGVIPFALK